MYIRPHNILHFIWKSRVNSGKILWNAGLTLSKWKSWSTLMPFKIRCFKQRLQNRSADNWGRFRCLPVDLAKTNDFVKISEDHLDVEWWRQFNRLFSTCYKTQSVSNFAPPQNTSIIIYFYFFGGGVTFFRVGWLSGAYILYFKQLSVNFGRGTCVVIFIVNLEREMSAVKCLLNSCGESWYPNSLPLQWRLFAVLQ